MPDIKTTELDLETSISDDDELLANISGGTARIPFKSLRNIIASWNGISGKPFDTLSSAYFAAQRSGDSVMLTFSGEVINALDKIGTFDAAVTELQDTSHSHDNKTVLDKFGTNSDGLLTWNDITVGAGGSGLDFSALSAAMTTGTQTGISVTADTENNRFDFEVTGIPVVAIDSDGYWTIDGKRGDNPTKAQGVDGFSPSAYVIENETGARITVIDKTGQYEADISNGKDGISPHIDSSTGHWFSGEADTGIKAKGDDGYSPSISLTETDTGIEVNVTNKDGTQRATILNGQNGADGKDGITTIQTSKVDKTCIFSAAGWSSTIPYTQTVSVEGITEALNPRIDVIISDNVVTGKKEETAFSYLTRVTTGNGILTAYCYETKPDVDLNIMIEVI